MTDARRAAPAQVWDARSYAENARFVADFGVAILDELAPQRGERIMDLGCGDGVLTAQIQARGATVVGIDSAPSFVAATRAAGIDARLMSADALAFDREFEAVFSNAALHWVLDPDAVLDGVRRALVPGGRFVGELGGHGNVAAIQTALRAALQARGIAVASPWYFPTAEAYAAKLEQHGFDVSGCRLMARPTPLPTGLHGWLSTFANPFVAGLDATLRETILAEVAALLAPSLCDETGRWTADYVRVRFRATRPR